MERGFEESVDLALQFLCKHSLVYRSIIILAFNSTSQHTSDSHRIHATKLLFDLLGLALAVDRIKEGTLARGANAESFPGLRPVVENGEMLGCSVVLWKWRIGC